MPLCLTQRRKDAKERKLLSAGMEIDAILADYEDLEREDILAVLAFATQLAQVKKIQVSIPHASV